MPVSHYLATVINVLEGHGDKELCLVLLGLILGLHADLCALLVQQVNLLLRSLQQCLEQHLLIDLLFNGQINEFLSVRYESTLFLPNWLAELAEVLSPEAQSPRVEVTDGRHSMHA